MAEEKKESKYAKKLVARRRYGGPEFRSLGNNKDGQDKFLPMPRPMQYDYVTNRPQYNDYAMVREALNTLLPFEKPEVIARYRRDHNASR